MKTILIFAGVLALAVCKDSPNKKHSLNGLALDRVCTKRNFYYAVEDSCDTYIECRDHIAVKVLCPDGLHYNPRAIWPEYPCSYPSDVGCKKNAHLQRAIETSDCPHLYGFYSSPIASETECGRYRMCMEGRAFELSCPLGLAFNAESGRCDWPEHVPSCDVTGFLGFKCPIDEAGKYLDSVHNYRHSGDCRKFFSCDQGRARLLSCDVGLAFDERFGRCMDAEYVPCARDQILRHHRYNERDQH